MMIAETGSILYVIGKSKAIVAADPRPGNTPTAVPKMAPTAAYKMFLRRQCDSKSNRNIV